MKTEFLLSGKSQTRWIYLGALVTAIFLVAGCVVAAPTDGSSMGSAESAPVAEPTEKSSEETAEETAEETVAESSTEAEPAVEATEPAAEEAGEADAGSAMENALTVVEFLPPADPPFSTGGWTTDFSKRVIDYADILSGGPPKDGIQKGI